MRYQAAIVSLLTLSCTAVLEGEGAPEPTNQNPGSGQNTGNDATPPASTTGGSGGTTGDGTPVAPAGAPFGVRSGKPDLLPFDVRVRRIAAALKVQNDNPMFGALVANRIKLGDYDHANGVLPDGLWIASRMANWADALAPVCASPEIKAAFPALPGDVRALTKAAWGRVITDEEVTEIQTSVTQSGLDTTTAYEATCMAIFTAAEFVFR